MALRIEMDAVDIAHGCIFGNVQEFDVSFGGYLLQQAGNSRRAGVIALERLRIVREPPQARWRERQNRGGGAVYPCAASSNRTDQDPYTPGDIFGCGREPPFQIVGPQSQNDEIQWPVRLETGRQVLRAISAGKDSVFPNRGPPIKTFLDDSESRPQRRLQHARPANLERIAVSRARNEPPSVGIAVTQYGSHDAQIGSLTRAALLCGKFGPILIDSPARRSYHAGLMHLVVIGAGNMGCVYGGNLARIGQQVTLIDIWEDHVRKIARDGLQVTGLTGDFVVRIQATSSAEGVAPADAALICVNAYSTAEAARTAKTVLKEDGYALTLQNGVGNIEILTEALGSRRVLAGLSFQSGDLEVPGKVRHTNNGPTYIGELDRSRSARLEAIAGLLQEGGLNPIVVDDIIATIWGKFVHNCGINAVCAITGLRPGQIREVPSLDEFQTRILEETLALLQARGIALPEENPIAAIKDYCAHKFHRPSMMQHLDRGQKTEIDALNGYVARESARLGLAAPYNDALARIVRGREHGAQLVAE